MGVMCQRCAEFVETFKVGDSNFSAGCDCWTSYSVTPALAMKLYIAEMDAKYGSEAPASHAIPPPQVTLGDLVRVMQLVGPADC